MKTLIAKLALIATLGTACVPLANHGFAAANVFTMPVTAEADSDTKPAVTNVGLLSLIRRPVMPLRWTLPTHVIQHPHQRAQAYAQHQANRRLRAGGGQFDFPTQLVGTTPDGNITLYVDPTLGQPAADLAQAVFAMAAQTYANCQAYFSVRGQPVNVILAAVNNRTDGTGGAYHYGCNFAPGGDLYCDVAFGNPTMTNGLIVAELTESFMGAQNAGWDCGGSNGEALSRFLAELESGGPGGALAAYSTGPAWDQAGQPDWIDATEPTDGNPVSTGCGIVYLYWMLSQGYSAAQITQAGCADGTLAANYTAQTGNATASADFTAAVAGLGGPIASDNPWGPIAAALRRPTGAGQVRVDTETRTVAVPPGWRVVQA
jgi:hypothetical protein